MADSCHSLVEIVTSAMAEARRSGHDHTGQIERAVAALLTAEPGLSQGAARRLVETLAS
ncbi:MAG: hypothetical protein NVV74_16370 [Magnetospirillum sp.]|nr:hypothetical protein [Magnetospirillum sp.]